MAILMISNEEFVTSGCKYYQIVSHDIQKLLKIHFPVAFSLGYDMTVDVTYELAVLILHSKGTHGPKHISRMNISCGVLEQIPALTFYLATLSFLRRTVILIIEQRKSFFDFIDFSRC
jgi:hypothetical protein